MKHTSEGVCKGNYRAQEGSDLMNGLTIDDSINSSWEVVKGRIVGTCPCVLHFALALSCLLCFVSQPL